MNEKEKIYRAINDCFMEITNAHQCAQQIVLLVKDEDLQAYRAASADPKVVDWAAKKRVSLWVLNVQAGIYFSHLDPLDF